jgi:hypothetical protein
MLTVGTATFEPERTAPDKPLAARGPEDGQIRLALSVEVADDRPVGQRGSKTH